MKYYLTEITTYNNGKNQEKGVYEFDDETTAIGKYYQKMGNMMLSEIVATEQLILTDECNVVIKCAPTFVRPVPTPEPEPEPTPEVETPEEQA
jgi:hypothetical protein